MIRYWNTAGHQRRSLLRYLGSALRQHLGGKAVRVCAISTTATGDQQSRFRQAIAGIKGTCRKAYRGKTFAERAHGAEPNGFRAAKSNTPARQIQSLQLRVPYALDAQLEGEIRSATDSSAVTGYRFQPAHRPLDKKFRRH